jgi:hypothetical protein
MRFVAACFTVACLSCGSDTGGATSGPIESIVSESRTATRLKAVRHKLDLAALPLSEWIGLPVRGTIEVDAAVTIPIEGGARDYRRARGSIAVRCVDTCTIGDDATRLRPAIKRPEAAAFLADGIAFSHIDLTNLEAELVIGDGTARLTRFHITSPDLDIAFAFNLTLAATLPASGLDACLNLRPTEALHARDPSLHALVSLANPVRSDDNFHHFKFAGSLAEPRVIGKICEVPAASGRSR